MFITKIQCLTADPERRIDLQLKSPNKQQVNGQNANCYYSWHPYFNLQINPPTTYDASYPTLHTLNRLTIRFDTRGRLDAIGCPSKTAYEVSMGIVDCPYASPLLFEIPASNRLVFCT